MNYYIIASTLILILLIYILFVKLPTPQTTSTIPTPQTTSTIPDPFNVSYEKYLSSAGDWNRYGISSISFGHWDDDGLWVDDIGVEGCAKKCNNNPDCAAFSYDTSERMDSYGRISTSLCKFYKNASRIIPSDLSTLYIRNITT